ncbi:MAG: GNAT family N-acetyltransferase [Actinomycetes bacterium]
MSPTPDGQQVGSHAGITFTVRGADCIDVLEPLWLHLFDHHASTGNAGIRSIDRSQSWPRRRKLYESLFAEPGTFVILAERDGEPVGYALCHLREGPDDTWDTGDWLGEIETLVLTPEARGNGVGTALMDAAEAELGRRGARDIMTAVMEGNDRIRDFYLRRGMRPTVTYLIRLAPQQGAEP